MAFTSYSQIGNHKQDMRNAVSAINTQTHEALSSLRRVKEELESLKDCGADAQALAAERLFIAYRACELAATLPKAMELLKNLEACAGEQLKAAQAPVMRIG